MIWDEGFGNPMAMLTKGSTAHAEIRFKGRRLKGKWALIRLKGKREKERTTGFSSGKRGTGKRRQRNIRLHHQHRTGRTMAEIEEGRDDKVIKTL